MIATFHFFFHFVLCIGAGAQYAPTQTGGSSSKTAIVTVYDTTLTVAQMPAHSHGGSTGVEDLGSIYYDINSNPCSAGMFSSLENEYHPFHRPTDSAYELRSSQMDQHKNFQSVCWLSASPSNRVRRWQSTAHACCYDDPHWCHATLCRSVVHHETVINRKQSKIYFVQRYYMTFSLRFYSKLKSKIQSTKSNCFSDQGTSGNISNKKIDSDCSTAGEHVRKHSDQETQFSLILLVWSNHWM